MPIQLWFHVIDMIRPRVPLLLWWASQHGSTRGDGIKTDHCSTPSTSYLFDAYLICVHFCFIMHDPFMETMSCMCIYFRVDKVCGHNACFVFLHFWYLCCKLISMLPFKIYSFLIVQSCDSPIMFIANLSLTRRVQKQFLALSVITSRSGEYDCFRKYLFT
jgi:hypothetical protein